MSALPANILPTDIRVSAEYAELLDTPEGAQYARVAAYGAFARDSLEKAISARDPWEAMEALRLLCAALGASDALALKGAGSLPPWGFAVTGTVVHIAPLAASAARSGARAPSEPIRIDIELRHEPIKVQLDQGKRRVTHKTTTIRRNDDGSMTAESDEAPQ